MSKNVFQMKWSWSSASVNYGKWKLTWQKSCEHSNGISFLSFIDFWKNSQDNFVKPFYWFMTLMTFQGWENLNPHWGFLILRPHYTNFYFALRFSSWKVVISTLVKWQTIFRNIFKPSLNEIWRLKTYHSCFSS